jgi:serine/threonine protein phosphatase PrpC
MGTTAAGLHLGSGSARSFNVGDSRVYVLRDGYLCQESVDDTAPGGGLLQCLGGGLRHVRPHIGELSWSATPLALLCTDGMHRHVPAGDMEKALTSPYPIHALWELSAGARDDVSVVLVDGRRTIGDAPIPVVTGRAHQRYNGKAYEGAGSHVRSKRLARLSGWRRRRATGNPS